MELFSCYLHVRFGNGDRLGAPGGSTSLISSSIPQCRILGLKLVQKKIFVPIPLDILLFYHLCRVFRRLSTLYMPEVSPNPRFGLKRDQTVVYFLD